MKLRILNQKAGTDPIGMLSGDELSRLSDDDLARIVRSVVSLLKDGLGASEGHNDEVKR